MAGEGPFGSVEMGGLSSVVKVRADFAAGDHKDPNRYGNPPGTVAYKVDEQTAATGNGAVAASRATTHPDGRTLSMRRASAATPSARRRGTCEAYQRTTRPATPTAADTALPRRSACPSRRFGLRSEARLFPVIARSIRPNSSSSDHHGLDRFPASRWHRSLEGTPRPERQPPVPCDRGPGPPDRVWRYLNRRIPGLADAICLGCGR